MYYYSFTIMFNIKQIACALNYQTTLKPSTITQKTTFYLVLNNCGQECQTNRKKIWYSTSCGSPYVFRCFLLYCLTICRPKCKATIHDILMFTFTGICML